MENLETTIREHCTGLASTRANERKKNAEALKDLLSRNALGAFLTNNAFRNIGFTWNNLFEYIKDYILKEAENYQTSKTYQGTIGPLCASLLHLCVSGANKGKANIKCENIMSACLYVLKDSNLTEAIGDAYLNLLYKHVLSHNFYIANMTPVYWDELLHVCISILQSNNLKLDQFTKLRLLWMVIKNGTSSCQLTIPLRDSLSKLRILRTFSDRKILEVAIDITILLLEMLAPEYRLTMCEFTENVLLSLLQFYEPSIDQKKKSSLFKLLDLAVNIHHPNGRFENEEGSLAHDWTIWNKHIFNTLEIICMEVSFLQKPHKQLDLSVSNCGQFYSLSATIYFQIFNLLEIPENSGTGNTPKRPRVALNMIKRFSDLILELEQNQIPWMGIILSYCKKYGSTVETSNFLLLMNTLNNFITNNINIIDQDCFTDMILLTVKELSQRLDEVKKRNEDFLLLWNSCVRHSMAVNSLQKPTHEIMQLLLTSTDLKYQIVQPLLKLYSDGSMPVNSYSVQTLSKTLQKFFNKCTLEERSNFLNWLKQGQLICLDAANAKELMLILIIKDNMSTEQEITVKSRNIDEDDNVHQIVFDSIEQSILFSEFGIQDIKDLQSSNNRSLKQNFQGNINISNEMYEYLTLKTTECVKNFKANSINLQEFINFIRVVLAYIDVMLYYRFSREDIIQTSEMYCRLRTSLRLMYTSVTVALNTDGNNFTKVKLLKDIQDILMFEYEPLLCVEVRRCIDEEFFYCINNIVNKDNSSDEELDNCDDESSFSALRCHCILVLSAYCRKNANYRTELLDLVLEYKMYDFDSYWDVQCVFQSIEQLSDYSVADPPLHEIFTIMMFMCRYMFRGSDETRRLLKILLSLLDRIWFCDNIRENCIIMVKGYLVRCGNLYYPARVAALVYKCAARMILLNRKHSGGDRLDEDCFIKAVIAGTKLGTHCLRLYCIYTLKLLLADYTDREIDQYISDLAGIFIVEVPENNELIVKDESANRTATLLHSYLALAQTKHTLIHKIVTSVLQIQKEKSLDENLVKKVLNIMSRSITKDDINVHLNNNILYILNSWFLKKNDVNDLPISLFAMENKQVFLKKHMRWLISAELLWAKNGNIFSSELLKETKNTLNKTDQAIFEECFCNIMVLCLPYVVVEKYNIEHSGMMKPNYQQLRTNATKMFQLMREVLENEKWSNLFEENIADLLFLAAKHLSDADEAGNMFQVALPETTETYYYPKSIFVSILTYFGELTDENIMQYLCENQSVSICKALFKLWDNILKQYVFEFKALALHAFITFVQSIPIGYISDAFICNFVCNSLTQAIKDSVDKREVKVLAKALNIILQMYLPEKVNHLRVAASHLLSILVIKKEEGFQQECDSLLSYLVEDLKDCLNDSEDVVDFINSLSQGTTDNLICTSQLQFTNKLKQLKTSLKCPSHESLRNMRMFLTNNQKFVNYLCDEIDGKGFSENCESSLMHQIIYSLSSILTKVSDKKTIIEACNCLSLIGTYNLKTVVTVSSSNPSQITKMAPNSYFTTIVMKTLSNVIFEEGPNLTKKVAKALNQLLKYRDGLDALNREDAEEVKQILKPFESAESNIVSNFQVNDTKLNSFNQSPNFWLPQDGEKHCNWLTRVTVTVIDILTASTNYFKELQEVCTAKPSVCQKILPSLIGLLLVCGNEKCEQTITVHMNNFFKYIWDISFEYKIENSGDSSHNKKLSSILDHDHKMITQYVLSVVHFVRLQSCHYESRRSRASALTLNYLQLEYDKVAWAATVADQTLAAIYYGELWAMAQNDRVPPASPEATTTLDGGKNIQRIFRKCFVSIGEMEAVDGCGTAHLTLEEERRRHLLHAGHYTDALLSHDIALSYGASTPDLQLGTLRALQKSGLFHLAIQHIKSLSESDQMNDVKYECLAALGDWSEVIDTRDLEDLLNTDTCNPRSIIKTFRYACLKDCLTLDAIPSNDKLQVSLNRAKLAISRLCQDLNMENCQNVYKVVAKLHLFTDIEDYYAVRTCDQRMQSLLNKWQIENLPAFQDFKHLEDLISQRNLMLEHAAKVQKNEFQDIVNLQLKYAELGLENDRVQLSQRFLATVKKLRSSEEVALVESKISWARGHTDIALSLLRNIVSNRSTNDSLTAKSLRQYGLWMAETKCDSPKDIVTKYLKKSLDVLNNTRDEKTRLKLYNDIAKFSDAEYKKVVAYMNSPIFQNKEECLKKMRHTCASSQQTQEHMTTDDKIALNTNNKFMHLEEAEIASTKAEKDIFLHAAMRYYLLSLAQCDENNLSIFRVISLWLENPGVDAVESQRLQQMLDGIASHKFIPALPQLAPRLSADTCVFADNLRRIIDRCAKDHPHHTLPILFSLMNSDKDLYILNSSARAAAAHSRRPQEPRVLTAESIVRSLANDPKLANIISQMEKLCDATISFANFTVKNKAPMRQEIPAAENIHKLGRLDAVPVPTVTIPVRHDCSYEDLPTLVSFDNYFELVGGINCPKKINCMSSDGVRRILLVKGKDDLRQDAVMQQVFNIVNTLLEKNAVTSRSKLLIRTYKVVPLSKRSGVLEWCVGTIPIGGYLVGSTGAHARYRPQDITCDAARKAMTKCHETGKGTEEKLRVFKKILEAFKPVFHYFFTEHYLDPVSWYERRQTYTKSVAASSMVGYVMGLGDRHVQNILIDKESAEVVHIDFGFAFDQGKILRTPETVPFRLTQDMIAGFGSCGVEGVFRRCCEKTMQLLRDNQETLLTILEVLLYDPLYSLTSSRQTAQSASRTTVLGAGDRHHLAERALLAVSSKLRAAGVAVPGHVARLLHLATDPANLCRLFPGWQPYL
ncbi:serine-protein kinase ATM [Plodia interpunctella]|uniref:serine-protein kinase ATM n=1 Tax=Plodia interpunctella TaxID=58824 RepID=UPI002368323E|nr:serine-protein kinase ATM [Plodia interpunctella]